MNDNEPEPQTLLGVVLPEPIRVAVLKEAASLVTGDRQEEYGPPEVNFQRIADIWKILLGVEFTPSQVALAMMGLKMARAAQGYKRDTMVDLAGYASLVVELEESGKDE